MLSLQLSAPSVQLPLAHPSTALRREGFPDAADNKTALQTVAIECHMEKPCVVCAAGAAIATASCGDAPGVGIVSEQLDREFGGRSRHPGKRFGRPSLTVGYMTDQQQRGVMVGVDSVALTLVGSALPFHCSPRRLCGQVSLPTCQEHCLLVRESSQSTASAWG